MNHEEYLKSVKAKMLLVMQDVDQNKLHPIEGVRTLLYLGHELDLSNDPVLLPLISIDSETMDYPVGKLRENYKPESLAILDRELEQIVLDEKKNLDSAFEQLKIKLAQLLLK